MTIARMKSIIKGDRSSQGASLGQKMNLSKIKVFRQFYVEIDGN